MDFIAGEDLKAGDNLTVGKDGKLYKIDSIRLSRIVEEEFIQSLKTNPAFSHINIDRELIRIDEWLKRHPDRRKTRRFVLGWLMRQEVPLKESNDFPENLRRFLK